MCYFEKDSFLSQKIRSIVNHTASGEGHIQVQHLILDLLCSFLSFEGRENLLHKPTLWGIFIMN